jgi:hypothetical protein
MMRYPGVGQELSCFIPLDSGSHHDHVDLLARLYHPRISRHARRLEKPTSTHAVLGHRHASPLSGPQDVGRIDALESCRRHLMALETIAQGGLLEYPCPHRVAGQRRHCFFACARKRRPV